MTFKGRSKSGILAGIFLAVSGGVAAAPLIVVEDHGGVSALPYYAILQPARAAQTRKPTHIPRGEAAMLPVRSMRLTPGEPTQHVIEAAGMRPFFLVGDDARSCAWLQHWHDRLREIGAVGLVVNVETLAALDRLRQCAPTLILSPVSGDDLARRWKLRHTPVLIVPARAKRD